MCIDILKKYYYNKPLPKTAAEYAKDYPKGYSRTMLKSKYGLTISQVLTEINKDYVKTNDVDLAKNRLKDLLDLKGIDCLDDINNLASIKARLNLSCRTCYNIWASTYDSLKQTKIGCPKCAGNSRLTEEGILESIESVEYKLISGLPAKLNRKTLDNFHVDLLHKTCGTTFSRNLAHLVYRGTRCPKCFPSKVYPVVVEGITFNSKFEASCYEILKPFNPLVHFKYKDIMDTTRRFTGDFLVRDKVVIEVTSYSEDSEYSKFKEHKDRLEEKQYLAESNGFKFIVIRSLSELKEFIKHNL